MPTKTNYPQYRKYYQSLDQTMQKPKTRLYTTAVLSFLAISLFAWYAIRPTITTILYLRREIADKTIVNKQMEEKINSLIEAQVSYQAIIQQVPLINEAIPTSTNMLSLLSQLKNLSNIPGASLSAIRVLPIALNENLENPTETEDQFTQNSELSPIVPIENQPETPKNNNGKVIEFPVTMLVTGNYATLKSVLDSLLSMRRLVSIPLMRIGLSQETNKTQTIANLLQLELKINGYFYQTR